MKRKDALVREDVIDFVMSCWDEEAGKNVNEIGKYLPSTKRYLTVTFIWGSVFCRWIWRTSGSRRAYTGYAQCYPDFGDLRCVGPVEHTSSDIMYVLSLHIIISSLLMYSGPSYSLSSKPFWFIFR